MNSISGSTSAAAETFNTLRDDVKKFLDPRYYRRFYLDESASIEDAVEDFISHGWEAGKNLNPVLHTQFIRTFYFDQAKSLPDFIDLIKRWHSEGRTILAVLHDYATVGTHFPLTMMLARELVAHGPTRQVLTSENQFRARQMCEACAGIPHVCGKSAA